MASKPTKKQLLDKLAKLGVDAPASATNAELAKLVKEAESAPADPAAPAEPEYKVMAVDCGSFPALNVRFAPSKSAPAIGELKTGDKVNVVEVVNGWARLEKGYCRAEYLV